MAPLTPDIVRRFWALASEVSVSYPLNTLEDWVRLYQHHYGLSHLEYQALTAYIHSRLPLIQSLM